MVSTQRFLIATLLLAVSIGAILSQVQAQDNDKKGPPGANKLQGVYVRTKDDTLTRFTFKNGEILYFADGPLGKLELEADYAIAKDGKDLYGRIRTVKEGSGPAKGDVFSFAFTVKGDTLTITDWKGSGVLALAAALQGEYKAETKKD